MVQRKQWFPRLHSRFCSGGWWHRSPTKLCFYYLKLSSQSIYIPWGSSEHHSLKHWRCFWKGRGRDSHDEVSNATRRKKKSLYSSLFSEISTVLSPQHNLFQHPWFSRNEAEVSNNPVCGQREWICVRCYLKTQELSYKSERNREGLCNKIPFSTN